MNDILLFISAIVAGFASILSPCVLPVLPIVAAGTEQDHKLRPALLVLGLSIAFVTMGILSAVAGGWLAGKMRALEIIAGALIITIGLTLALDLDVFKQLSWFQRISTRTGSGPFSGLLLGLALGLVWIPCVGPFLSSILAMVAGQGDPVKGALLLLFYSIGFSVPVLIAGYASQWFRSRMQTARRHAVSIRITGAVLLIGLGAYIVWRGSYGLSSLAF